MAFSMHKSRLFFCVETNKLTRTSLSRTFIVFSDNSRHWFSSLSSPNICENLFKIYENIIFYQTNKDMFLVETLHLEHEEDTHPERFCLPTQALGLMPLHDSSPPLATYYNIWVQVHQTWWRSTQQALEKMTLSKAG